MDSKAKFVEIFSRCVTRHGHAALLGYLESATDFFTAPASAKYHGAHEGGLVEHSLNVYRYLRDFTIRDTLEAGQVELWPEYEEAVAIIALLHDVCKANCYKTVGEVYVYEDALPLGHGEKSLYLIQRCMDLTPMEAVAIRWHMGAYDDAVKGGSRAMGAAMCRTPWVWRLQEADMCATWIDEREGEPQ